MSNYLVTGARNNTPHITSMDDASLNAGILGNGAYILNRGEKLRAEMISANELRLYDGDLVAQGRHIRIETSDVVDLTVDNGTTGAKRNDLVVARYENDIETGVESVEFVVIKGTPSANPTDPTYNTGNIFNGDLIVDFPLYRIRLDGLTVSAPVRLLDIAEGFGEKTEPNFAWNATNTNPASGSIIRFVEALGIAFFKGYVSVKRDFAANYSYLIGTVPSGYRPNYRQPLTAITAAGDVLAIYIDETGQVYLQATSNIAANTGIYFNGFWFV